MTDCPADRELDRLLANQLSVAEETALEAHVAGCAACQARLELLTGGRLTLLAPQAGAIPDGPNMSFSAGVLERVAALHPAQVQLLEQEHALGGGNGVGRPTPPRSPREDTTAPAGRPRFTVLSPHAEGGLGRVHLARDEQLRRTVALKEIRPERAGDPRVRQRFLDEAEITGQLEHPGVVPIYALEHDDAGRPVYAMRFIQGRTLHDAIEDHHWRPTALGLRELLQRFISVCQTVAYAHSKGVIHRDLKPDNVMLGAYGETLVVDWGLAKRLGDRDDSFVVESGPDGAPTAGAAVPSEQVAGMTPARTILAPAVGSEQLTAAGTVMGTPAYMAPEQARGEALSPAADVYALGAVLFSIVTGKVPYEGTSAVEVLRKVAAGEPPSAVGVFRALSAIYFKAMAPDPRSRYASAAELARDVERWLADEPVGADREPWSARAGRWARRHRTLVTSLGVAAVLLVTAGVGVAWWQSRLGEERRAEQARTGEQVEALLDRCEAAIAADDAVGAGLAVGDAEKRAGNLGSDHLRERLARCRSAADLLAELDRIDDLRWATEDGKFQGSRRAVREWPGALARLGVVVGRIPPAEAAALVNGSLARERLLATLDLWLVHAPPEDRVHVGDLLAAADADSFRDAVRAAVARSDWEEVKALAARDEATRQPARFAAAVGSIGALPLNRKLKVLETAAHARPRAFAVLMTAGDLYRVNDAGTAADRLAWYRAAVTARPESGVARLNLGIALRDKGDLDGAVAELRAAIALDPSDAMAHNNLGVALNANKDLDGAIAEYRTAIALDPKSFLAHNNLGNALTVKGDLNGAVAAFHTAIALNLKLATPHNNLGFALQSKGDLDGGVAEFLAAIALDPKYALAHYNLGNARKEKGDLGGAVAAFREADRLGLKGVGPHLAEAERWRAMLPRLDDVAAGKAEPASAAEAAEFSLLCRQPFLKRYAASARLYARACATDPKYATDASTFVGRYDAVRSAALAGCGQGADAPPRASGRAALRGQALAWLETNQKLLARRLASGTARDRQYVAEQLSAWLTEKDLAGVRPGAVRDGWSPSEAAAWDRDWSDVRTLLAQANEGPPRRP